MRCMRRLFLAIPLFIAVFWGCSRDAQRTPVEVLDRYYSENTPRGAHVVGHRPLMQGEDRAVFATTIERGDGVAEWYTFLAKDTQKGWSVEAAKTLTFPDSYYELVDSTEQKKQSGETLKPEEANLALTVSSDSSIKAYLIDHEAVLDSIIDLFTQRAVMSPVDVGRPSPPEVRDGKVLPTNRNERIQELLERAQVTRVFRDARYPLCTFIRINGMARSEVGYIYADDGCVVPPMSPDHFIYVEKATGNWYVYKVI
jgi:hypothetical protein